MADKVWISSGHFKFKLGRDGLDMISPQWEQFNHTSMMEDRTMFCLHVPAKDDLVNVKGEMLGLKPELLLFLRKLRKINIKIAQEEDHVVHEFSLHREDNTDNIQDGYSTTRLSRSDVLPSQQLASDELVVFRHTTSSMPEEAKRIDIKHSEIVLALPLGSSTCSRPTFNFLPIRDYGFPFLLHADFITTVNREDINHHNNWNHALVTASADLFVQCINTINRVDTEEMLALKYQWPRFIKPTHTAPDTIMADFFTNLRDRLKKERVLISQAGQLTKPGSLSILPKRWVDNSTPAQPLFRELQHRKQYISTSYAPAEISRLGLKEEPGKYFANLLKKLPAGYLQQQSIEWHSMIATAMIIAPPVPPTCLQDIAMIPLRDGNWIAAGSSDHAIYFPDTSNNVHVPDGIQVRIVETGAAEDSSRKSLFRKLGVRDLDNKQVCHLILERHESLEASTSELMVDTLIDHAKYLYKHRDDFDEKRMKALKLAVDGGGNAVCGRELYMDSNSEGTFRMSAHFTPSAECKFIHKSYLNNSLDNTRLNWEMWLRRSCGISTKPDLVVQQASPSPPTTSNDLGNLDFRVHPLFQHLMDLPDSSVWLTLLKDEWVGGYKIANDLLPKYCLSQALVTCKHGQQRPLNKVYWATSEVLKEPLALVGVDLLELNDGGKPWRETDFLDVFGVKRKTDLEFFIGILRKAARGDFVVTFSDVLRLMKGIQSRTTLNNWATVR